MDLLIRLIVAVIVAAVIVWLLPFGLIADLIALAAFLLILFGPWWPDRAVR